MPLRIPDKLPAIDILKKENIFVMDSSRAVSYTHLGDERPYDCLVMHSQVATGNNINEIMA